MTLMELPAIRRISAFLFFLFLSCAAVAFAFEHGSIRGKVENDSGKAVNGAQVTAEREGNEVGRATTNSKGEFTLSLEPGEYQLSVEAEGYKSIQLLRKQKVESGKTTKLDGKLTLEASRSSSLLRGAVFNENGFSLPGATVVIERI